MLVATRVDPSGALSSVRRQLASTRRLVRLAPLVVAPALASLLVWRAELASDLAELVFAVAVALGLSSVFADSAATTVAASPTSLLRRSTTRLVIAIPTACVCWVTARATTFGALLDGDGTDTLAVLVPGVEAWLVVAAVVLLMLAVEAAAARAGATPGVIGSGVVLVSMGVAQRLPAAGAVLPVADHEVRWIGLIIICALLLAAALRDPGRHQIQIGRSDRA